MCAKSPPDGACPAIALRPLAYSMAALSPAGRATMQVSLQSGRIAVWVLGGAPWNQPCGLLA